MYRREEGWLYAASAATTGRIVNAELPLDESPEKEVSRSFPQLLRGKYPRDRYALFFEVPDAVGLDQHRRIDAVAFGLWKSVGRRIEGFECKSSRSDWLRELKQVDKADPFIAVCDFFWLVTSDSSIAKIEEVPACWGWLSATKSGLRVQRPASRLPGAGESIPRSFLLGVLRKMQDDMLANPDVAAVIEERVQHTTNRLDTRVKWETQNLQRRVAEAQSVIAKFKEQSGIALDDWRFGDVGKFIRQISELGYGDGLGHVPKFLEGQENALVAVLEKVREARTTLAQLPRLSESDAGG